MIEGLGDLGDLFRQFREASKLTQEDLASRCGPGVNRSQVAHLEQGLRIPKPASLRAIAGALGIPEETWAALADEQTHQRQQFEASLAELAGRSVALRSMELQSVRA